MNGCENATTADFNPIWLNHTMAKDAKCNTYNKNWTNVDQCIKGDDTIFNTTIDCHEWVFDKSYFQSTIVTEVNICLSLPKVYRNR